MLQCRNNILYIAGFEWRMWKLDWQHFLSRTFGVSMSDSNEWCCSLGCDLSKILCEHIQLHSDLIMFMHRIDFPKYGENILRRLWQSYRTRHRHGISRGGTGDRDRGGDCEITANRGAYHPTIIIHFYCVLLGIFPEFNAELGVCSFVTWKELQHNEVS